MVTSWNWVFVTDFSSFKPTYLPEVSRQGDTKEARIIPLTFPTFLMLLQEELAMLHQKDLLNLESLYSMIPLVNSMQPWIFSL
jgi:hypothetical protein